MSASSFQRFFSRTWRAVSPSLSLSLALAACSPAREPSAPAASGRGAAAASAPSRNAAPSLPTTRVAWVPPGTFGPYLGTRGEVAIAAWAAEREGKRHWFTLALGKHGTPLGDPREVADAAPEVDLVAVRPTGGADAGFTLLSTSREFSGERLDVVGLGSRGEMLGGPATLAQSQSDIVWIDSISTPHGALALWAVRRDDRAELYGVPLGVSGEPRERPVILVPDARAWQVTAVPNGVAIVALTAGKERGQRGPLSLVFADEQAHVDKKVRLADGQTVEPDVDLARFADTLVIAWSDTSGPDSRITGMTVDVAGNIQKTSAPLVPAFGPQTLLRVVPSFGDGAQGYLVWENLLEKERGQRVFRVGALSRDLLLSGGIARITASSDAVLPELVASKSGVAAIVPSYVCERGRSCDGSSTAPTFVALDTSMHVVASEPILFGGTGARPAELAWGLRCAENGCDALVAGPGNPTPVYAVDLGAGAGRYQPAAQRAEDLPVPRASRVEAIARTERVADVAAARAGDASVVAWVTDLDPATPFARIKTPAPDGKYEAPRAILRVQAAPPGGPPGVPGILSYRAHSLGGVALSPGDPSRSEALLAWTGVDNRLPEVFLTLLGLGGKKTAQKMLTHGGRDVSDVSAAFTGDGWVVAWSDERSGVPRIYVAKVDRGLKPVVRERLLSSSELAQTGVELLSRGDHVLAIWSQASPSSASLSDIFAARLSSKDLGRIGPEHALAATGSRARMPQLDAFGEGAVAAWVEEPPGRGPDASTDVVLTRLDSGGEVVGGETEPVRIAGFVTGVAVRCDGPSCRVVASVAREGGGTLEAIEWRPGHVSEPTVLLPFEGRPRGGTRPVFLDADLVYSDDRAGGDARVRRAVVLWK